MRSESLIAIRSILSIASTVASCSAYISTFAAAQPKNLLLAQLQSSGHIFDSAFQDIARHMIATTLRFLNALVFLSHLFDAQKRNENSTQKLLGFQMQSVPIAQFHLLRSA